MNLPGKKCIQRINPEHGRIRILVVIGQLEVGGAETHLLRVMTRLDPQRFEVLIYALRPGGPIEAALRDVGLSVMSPPKWPRSVLGIGRIALHLARTMRRLQPDILHFFLPESYVLGSLCALGIPNSIRIMSRRSLNNYQQRIPMLKPLERLMHPHMHAVLGNSRAVTRQLLDEGIRNERLGLIYNGIEAALEPSPARELLRQQLGIGKDTLLLVVVANLIPYKGHCDLLDALAKVATHLPLDWKLVCLGRDDGYGVYLQQCAQRLGLQAHVAWPGYSNEINAWMRAADIGVLPSHEEGFSNSLLEGLATGLAMVVTAVGGNAEAVEDGVSGLTVPPRDPKVLGEALLRLSTDSNLRRRLGSAARDRIHRHFSLTRCVANYAQLYQVLFDSKGCQLPTELQAWCQ